MAPKNVNPHPPENSDKHKRTWFAPKFYKAHNNLKYNLHSKKHKNDIRHARERSQQIKSHCTVRPEALSHFRSLKFRLFNT